MDGPQCMHPTALKIQYSGEHELKILNAKERTNFKIQCKIGENLANGISHFAL